MIDGMIQSVEELPNYNSITNLYCDLETTSGSDHENSLNPWKNCEILGIAVTVDDDPEAYYVPLRHRNTRYNLPIEPVYNWYRNLIKKSKKWTNHNVKYDVQVSLNCVPDLSIDHLELIDTITLAKIINSDRFGFDLTKLVKDWCYQDISEHEKAIKVYTHSPGGKLLRRDYAVIPADVMAPYARTDVLAVRMLYHKEMEMLPEECREVMDIEISVTKALIEIERNGLALDIQKVAKDFIVRLPRALRRLEKVLHEKAGRIFRPHVNDDLYEILHVQLGLPILEWTKPSKKTPMGVPSFGKSALKSYLGFPGAPKSFIKLIMRYKRLHKLLTAFVHPYIKLAVHETKRLHGTINQTVRTGRTAMSKPNMQQVPSDAKVYIIPDPGCVLLEYDLSQIEYRYIASYTENPRILQAYRDDPKTDYHKLMAELCKIKRKPAKNMNFAVSFGAGEEKTIRMLRGSFDPKDVPGGEVFDEYCAREGKKIFNTYHANFPELRIEKARSTRAAKQRGYVRNVFNRRRYIRIEKAYIAFNTVVQSSAADLAKRITVRLQEFTRGTGIKLLVVVHDSWLFNVPKELVEEWKPKIKQCIEETETRMSVPLYCSCSQSETNWRECK